MAVALSPSDDIRVEVRALAHRIPLLLILICSVKSVAGTVSDGDTGTATPIPEPEASAVEPNPSQTVAAPEFPAPSPALRLDSGVREQAKQ